MRAGADRVFLARHGRTALNAEGRLRGFSDPPLDDVGRGQAARLANALAPQHPAAIICSPLQRAVSTAEAIGAACGVPIAADARLKDRDYGPMNGRLIDEVKREYGSVDAAPGVEPLAALAARARRAFDELVADYGAGPLVMVAHDAFNRALLGQLDHALVDVRQRIACWNQLSCVDGQWRVDGYDLVAD